MMKARIFRSGTLVAGGLALMMGFASEASAQFYSRPHVYGGFYSGEVYLPPVPRRSVGLGASAIMEELEERGFRPLGIVSRRPDIFVIDALDRRNQPVRLVVDAFDGEILERFARQDHRDNGLRAPAPLGSDARRTDQLNKRDQAKTPRTDTRVAEVPTPPRRPAATSSPSSGPMPALRPAPVAPARDPSQWAPINTVPVTPLE